ncbi:TniQ family protein [Dactylosporangium sp. CA-139066]|uniref:TniQ family protein n=1 Tax=Dactylosporangium sp. CA-139066 TaxID=3239930 RepID=UPI003D942A20
MNTANATRAARTLPLRIDLGDGEAIDSWLLRLAHRNGMPLRWLTTALGFGDRLAVWRNYALTWKLPPELLRRIESQTGLPAGALEAAVLDQFDRLGWRPIPGSRFCPACLAEFDGRWPIRWQLPYTFACPTHHTLLAVLCPACHRTPRSLISERSGLAPPTRCTLGTTRHASACDGDLQTHPILPLDPADPRLATQAWINTRLDRLDDAAVTDLRDLDALASWFLHRIQPAELQHLGDDTAAALITHRNGMHGLKRHPPTAGLIAAAMATHAVSVLTADDRDRAERVMPLLRNVYTAHRPVQRGDGDGPPARGPMLSQRRLDRLSEPLRRAILTAIDTLLPAGERLRYRTCTTTPRTPGARAAADRARHVPQHLWPDWLVRFLAPRGAHVAEVAANIPKALLIPGNPARNLHAAAELGPWRSSTGVFLTTTARHHPETLIAICALADYLDEHGSPIDYRRRRTTFTDITLTQQQWHDLSYQAGTDPGRAGRHLAARRYLFQLLTGADLTNPQHQLAITSSVARTALQQFSRTMTTALRDALDRHATELLHAAGIDEPLIWSPPADCVAGLVLPGREPRDIDLATARTLLDVEHLAVATVARRLGVTAEHVRYAQQQFHRPPPALRWNSRTAARQARDRAAAELTKAFFDREYHQAGRTLRDLADAIGIPYQVVAERARAHAVPVGIRRKKSVSELRSKPDKAPTLRTAAPARSRITPRPPRETNPKNQRVRIDPDWLREQAGALRRPNTDIANELGLSHETIRRHRHRLGIPARPSGGAGHAVNTRRHPALPTDLRRAAEGQRHGWQRLRRFEQTAAHPSINAAAQALGLHQQNLFHQLDRLEHDIGAALIHRTNNRHQPMTLTQRGQRLLQQLARPNIRHLLNLYAPPTQTKPRRLKAIEKRQIDEKKQAINR